MEDVVSPFTFNDGEALLVVIRPNNATVKYIIRVYAFGAIVTFNTLAIQNDDDDNFREAYNNPFEIFVYNKGGATYGVMSSSMYRPARTYATNYKPVWGGAASKEFGMLIADNQAGQTVTGAYELYHLSSK
jgi:hypothetical protein